LQSLALFDPCGHEQARGCAATEAADPNGIGGGQ